VEPVPGHRLPVEKTDFDTVLVREKSTRPPRLACATCERTWLTESEDDADETCPKCGGPVHREN
jgi:rRNA maturation endonuclease Nob1